MAVAALVAVMIWRQPGGIGSSHEAVEAIMGWCLTFPTTGGSIGAAAGAHDGAPESVPKTGRGTHGLPVEIEMTSGTGIGAEVEAATTTVPGNSMTADVEEGYSRTLFRMWLVWLCSGGSPPRQSDFV